MPDSHAKACQIRPQYPGYGPDKFMDITSRIARYRELAQTIWDTITSPGGLDQSEFLEGDELFAVACTCLFQMIVVGSPSVHSPPLRWPNEGPYPFEDPLDWIEVWVGPPCHGALRRLHGSTTWEQFHTEANLTLCYIDIFGWPSSASRQFLFARCMDSARKHEYLIPFDQLPRFISTRSII